MDRKWVALALVLVAIGECPAMQRPKCGSTSAINCKRRFCITVSFCCRLQCVWFVCRQTKRIVSPTFHKRILSCIAKRDAPTLGARAERGIGEFLRTVHSAALRCLLPALWLGYAWRIGPTTLARAKRGDILHPLFVGFGSNQCSANLYKRMAANAYTRFNSTHCAAHACTVYDKFCHNSSLIYWFLPRLLPFSLSLSCLVPPSSFSNRRDISPLSTWAILSSLHSNMFLDPTIRI